MADRKHKIFTKCKCDNVNTCSKDDVSDDISNILMYMRVLETTKETIHNIERRKDTHDINSNILKQRKRDIIKLNKLIEKIKDKYGNEYSDTDE